MSVQNIYLNNTNNIPEIKQKVVEKPVSSPIEKNNSELVSKDGNSAILNSALASLNLAKTSNVIQNGKEYQIEGKYKVVDEVSTDIVNKQLAQIGYTDEPYKNGETAKIIELTKDAKFVRTYDKENSHMKGSWLMKYEDIKGLSPEEIADKFALPQVPKYICDCTLKAGTKLRTGECNPLYGWNGGGQQFDLMGVRTGDFGNEREIGKKLA